MRVIDVNSRDMLLDENFFEKFENILIYDISCTTFMGSIPLCIRRNLLQKKQMN